jgi:hypothetical protein
VQGADDQGDAADAGAGQGLPLLRELPRRQEERLRSLGGPRGLRGLRMCMRLGLCHIPSEHQITARQCAPVHGDLLLHCLLLPLLLLQLLMLLEESRMAYGVLILNSVTVAPTATTIIRGHRPPCFALPLPPLLLEEEMKGVSTAKEVFFSASLVEGRSCNAAREVKSAAAVVCVCAQSIS